MVLVMFCTGLHLNDSCCSVDVHHDNRGVSGHVSWAQNFSITLDQNVIHLLQNHVVEVSKGKKLYVVMLNAEFISLVIQDFYANHTNYKNIQLSTYFIYFGFKNVYFKCAIFYIKITTVEDISFLCNG